MLFNKVLGENEKCVFYFYLKKPKELFGQPNTKAVFSLNVRFWLH